MELNVGHGCNRYVSFEMLSLGRLERCCTKAAWCGVAVVPKIVPEGTHTYFFVPPNEVKVSDIPTQRVLRKEQKLDTPQVGMSA